jgi:hypothetical protein
MAELDKGKPVSLEELMVSTLAMTDALAKLLIEKGVITDAEFKQKLLEERAVYQRILNSTTQLNPRLSQAPRAVASTLQSILSLGAGGDSLSPFLNGI